jgi:phytanoyl-CoA dioxygenase PhyH
MKVMPADEVRDLKRSLDEDGYVVVRDVVSKERLAELADAVGQEFERAKRDGELFHGGGSLSGHLNSFPGEGSRFVYDDIAERGILDLARAVDEEKAERLRVTMNYNLPGSSAQFYHIDDLFSEAFLICNIAVVDTDVTNGAIDLLPGTNDRFYRFWEYAVQRKYRLTTRIPMRQGDVLLRMSTLWHRGMPNQSAKARPMMSITFGEKSAPDGDPFMVNDGKIAFTPNWFNPSRMGRLRERSFVAMPWTYSGYRFARSLWSDRGNTSW